ncbi:hypothetical protein RRG08_025585 [Elysia crispata]|uniref:Uncharacterized protein n=1 Tax=Elysia crispata TaxID=231223 RepID=A0AAE0YEK6_9GAST|nr:hypothetical protein RRG08_025585 [Elysia crispata]
MLNLARYVKTANLCEVDHVDLCVPWRLYTSSGLHVLQSLRPVNLTRRSPEPPAVTSPWVQGGHGQFQSLRSYVAGLVSVTGLVSVVVAQLL